MMLTIIYVRNMVLTESSNWRPENLFLVVNSKRIILDIYNKVHISGKSNSCSVTMIVLSLQADLPGSTQGSHYVNHCHSNT